MLFTMGPVPVKARIDMNRDASLLPKEYLGIYVYKGFMRPLGD